MFDKILFIFVKQPENILFGKDGRMKIADFGLVAEMNEEEIYSQGVGTRGYRAPEVVTGRYNEKADVYSLSVIMMHFFNENCKYEVSIYALRTLCFLFLNILVQFVSV